MASGPDDIGPVNLSPKGGVPLHVLGPNRVAYLDHTGSGNETARHSIAGGPITIMVCSFDEDNAAIVRLYGTARVTPLEGSPLADVLVERPAAELKLPERQVIEIDGPDAHQLWLRRSHNVVRSGADGRQPGPTVQGAPVGLPPERSPVSR